MPTPMMQQYQDAKAACPDAVLLFRMGDFYEMFHDDAKTAARVLNLALTSREKGAGAIPMAGFPYHQLESYLGKLIAAGLRAAVCEQVEDPKQAKGLVRRELTRVVSAGTITDDALLDPRSSNYLAAVVPGGGPGKNSDDPAGIAWVDLSTGRFQAACVPPGAWPTNWPGSLPANACWPTTETGRFPFPPVGCSSRAGRAGRSMLRRPASRWPGSSARYRWKGSASMAPRLPPFARRAPCSSIWSKRKRLRSRTSIGWSIIRPPAVWKSTSRRAAAWS